MIETHELLGPQSEEEERIFAEQDVLYAVQHCIQRAMAHAGVSQKELAKKIGKSPASVSQFFSAEANPTLRNVACLTRALEIDLHVSWRPRNAEHCYAVRPEPKMEVVRVCSVIHRPDATEWQQAAIPLRAAARPDPWRSTSSRSGEPRRKSAGT
jgi:ribosome-binding protein aMBF1 (putative translation factor)